MARINESQQVLVSTAILDASLAAITLVAFWLGVFAFRWFGAAFGYSVSALGLSRPKMGTFTGAGLGLLVGVGALVVNSPLSALSAFLLERFGYSVNSTVQEPFMRGLQGWVEENPLIAIPAIVVVVVLLGPAVEELVFRGAIFGGLRRLGDGISASFDFGGAGKVMRRFWFVLAALSSSIFFALLHLEPVLLPALVVLAITLCWLYEKTGSLLPPLVAHATFNSFATIIIILDGLGVIRIPV